MPLCVDLDGTLVRSDTLIEGLLSVLGGPGILHLPELLCLQPRRLQEARWPRLSPIDPALLPYNEDVLAYLRAQEGPSWARRLVLVTAADTLIAQGVAGHLDFRRKSSAPMARPTSRAPPRRRRWSTDLGTATSLISATISTIFRYGAQARSIGIVSAPASVAAAARKGAKSKLQISTRPSVLRAALKVMRPHQ